jgi:predicted ATPase/class 3 adenylate cyclase
MELNGLFDSCSLFSPFPIADIKSELMCPHKAFFDIISDRKFDTVSLKAQDNMDEIPSFGKWLRQRRRTLDLTQEELAHQVGCAPITIRKLEGDEMRPSKQLALSISGPLGITADQREDFIRFARTESMNPAQAHLFSTFESTSARIESIHTAGISNRDLPSGTVHLLFCEIGNSTQLIQQLENNYAHILEEYQRVLRSTLPKWNGYEVSAHSDSFFAVFSRATDAVSAAIEAQHALANESWIDSVHLLVRMGIHTGEPLLVNNDYVGTDVNRAARICAAAYPGQVLLTSETRIMVERHMPGNSSLRDLGNYRLKDLTENEHLYQLVMSDLPTDFPPLKSLEVMPNNLPTQLTRFIGREREMEEIKHLLRGERLITLTGAGGTGKTRLAIEVVKQVQDQYPDGAWLIDFVAVPEGSLILQAIASALGVREEPSRPIVQTLTDYLRSKKLLLLFDNCEHLIVACAQVAETLLQACPELCILTTSREALGIGGENQYHVPTLTVPEIHAALSLETLKQSEAVRVFLDRAAMVRPAFKLTKANALAIAQICRKLDGIPLAIELAAARVKGLNVEQISERLDDRFNLLSTGNRTALPRHQTLRATIDWSYNLLSEKERVLLSRLSVFKGGWTAESATEVCLIVQLEEPDVLNLILNLADKSLVIAEEQEGKTRYRLLETIREYALEKLVESGEERLVRNRHLDFFITLAEEAEQKYRTREQLLWFDAMERERDNFRSALDYVLRTQQSETALRLVSTAFWLWFFRGPWSEGQIWTEAALAMAANHRTKEMAKTLMAHGLLRFAQSDHASAQITLEKSLAIWRELDDKWWCAFVLDFLGITIRRQDEQASSRFFDESLRLAEETNENWILAYSLWNKGENELYLKNLLEAQRLLDQCLEISQSLGDRMLQNEALRALGEISEAKQEYTRAVDLYKESLAIVQDLQDITNVSVLYFNVGRALQLAGENAEAERYFRDALLQSQQLGKRAGVLRALAGLGVVSAAKGEVKRAVYLISASQFLFTKSGLRLPANQLQWIARHAASARAQLGEAQSDQISAQAQAMSLDQVVEYALNETSE